MIQLLQVYNQKVYQALYRHKEFHHYQIYHHFDCNDNSLYIHNKTEIKIEPEEICEILNKRPGKYLKEILNDIEYKLVNKELENDNNVLRTYIINNYCNFSNNDIQ